MPPDMNVLVFHSRVALLVAVCVRNDFFFDSPLNSCRRLKIGRWSRKALNDFDDVDKK